MPLLSLDINPPPPVETPVSLPPSGRYLRLTYSTSRRWIPGRGLLFSLLLHEIAIVALAFYPPSSPSRARVWREKQWDAVMMSKEVLYLPQIGGGHAGGSSKKSVGEEGQGPNSPAPAVNARGVIYPGRQEIVSNPPNPTNRIQTVLHPDLPNPPPLKAYVPLPNMVMMAQALPAPPPPRAVAPPPTLAPTPALQPPQPTPQPAPPPVEKVDLSKVQARVPVVSMNGPTPLEAPHLTLPAEPPAFSSPSLPQAAPPPPASAPVAPKAPEAKAAPIRPQELPSTTGHDAHNLLALSPFPAPPNAAARVPEGEARGQFAISPDADLSKASSGIGAAKGIGTVGGAGTAAPSGTAIGNGSGNRTEGLGVSGRGSGISGGGGGGGGSGTAGGGHGAGGNGGGVGSGIGPGSGSGIGIGPGTGRGAGAGPGAGPFAGMTIQGGEGPAGAISIAGPSAPQDGNQKSGSYGLTIVSTGNSGGGVGDFGIFHDEAVYTVYLNHAAGNGDPGPVWPLQYALLGPPGAAFQDLRPPFALKKQMPLWPADLLTRFQGQEMVVYGVIDAEGKMQQLKILQSPDAQLSDILLRALEQWVFRPASVNGRPVAVKAVLGVPITSGQ